MNDPEDPPLGPTEQLMMAYVDDELDAADRQAFERRLAAEPELAAEVAGFFGLSRLTASMARLEPTDHEIRRFWSRFYNRTEWRIGWVLFGAGMLGLLCWGIEELIFAPLSWFVKLSIVSAGAGATLLLISTLRLKLRTSRLDRYRGVMR